jgi:hypothetical protein
MENKNKKELKKALIERTSKVFGLAKSLQTNEPTNKIKEKESGFNFRKKVDAIKTTFYKTFRSETLYKSLGKEEELNQSDNKANLKTLDYNAYILVNKFVDEYNEDNIKIENNKNNIIEQLKKFLENNGIILDSIEGKALIENLSEAFKDTYQEISNYFDEINEKNKALNDATYLETFKKSADNAKEFISNSIFTSVSRATTFFGGVFGGAGSLILDTFVKPAAQLKIKNKEVNRKFENSIQSATELVKLLYNDKGESLIEVFELNLNSLKSLPESNQTQELKDSIIEQYKYLYGINDYLNNSSNFKHNPISFKIFNQLRTVLENDDLETELKRIDPNLETNDNPEFVTKFFEDRKIKLEETKKSSLEEIKKEIFNIKSILKRAGLSFLTSSTLLIGKGLLAINGSSALIGNQSIGVESVSKVGSKVTQKYLQLKDYININAHKSFYEALNPEVVRKIPLVGELLDNSLNNTSKTLSDIYTNFILDKQNEALSQLPESITSTLGNLTPYEAQFRQGIKGMATEGGILKEAVKQGSRNFAESRIFNFNSANAPVSEIIKQVSKWTGILTGVIASTGTIKQTLPSKSKLDYKEKLSKVQKEIEAMQIQRPELLNSKEFQKEIERIKALIEKDKEIARLNNELEVEKNKNPEAGNPEAANKVSELEKTIVELTAELEDIKNQLVNANTANNGSKISDLESKIEQLNIEIVAKNNEIAQLKATPPNPSEPIEPEAAGVATSEENDQKNVESMKKLDFLNLLNKNINVFVIGTYTVSETEEKNQKYKIIEFNDNINPKLIKIKSEWLNTEELKSLGAVIYNIKKHFNDNIPNLNFDNKKLTITLVSSQNKKITSLSLNSGDDYHKLKAFLENLKVDEDQYNSNLLKNLFKINVENFKPENKPNELNDDSLKFLSKVNQQTINENIKFNYIILADKQIKFTGDNNKTLNITDDKTYQILKQLQLTSNQENILTKLYNYLITIEGVVEENKTEQSKEPNSTPIANTFFSLENVYNIKLNELKEEELSSLDNQNKPEDINSNKLRLQSIIDDFDKILNRKSKITDFIKDDDNDQTKKILSEIDQNITLLLPALNNLKIKLEIDGKLDKFKIIANSEDFYKIKIGTENKSRSKRTEFTSYNDKNLREPLQAIYNLIFSNLEIRNEQNFYRFEQEIIKYLKTINNPIQVDLLAGEPKLQSQEIKLNKIDYWISNSKEVDNDTLLNNLNDFSDLESSFSKLKSILTHIPDYIDRDGKKTSFDNTFVKQYSSKSLFYQNEENGFNWENYEINPNIPLKLVKKNALVKASSINENWIKFLGFKGEQNIKMDDLISNKQLFITIDEIDYEIFCNKTDNNYFILKNGTREIIDKLEEKIDNFKIDTKEFEDKPGEDEVTGINVIISQKVDNDNYGEYIVDFSEFGIPKAMKIDAFFKYINENNYTLVNSTKTEPSTSRKVNTSKVMIKSVNDNFFIIPLNNNITINLSDTKYDKYFNTSSVEFAQAQKDIEKALNITSPFVHALTKEQIITGIYIIEGIIGLYPLPNNIINDYTIENVNKENNNDSFGEFFNIIFDKTSIFEAMSIEELEKLKITFSEAGHAITAQVIESELNLTLIPKSILKPNVNTESFTKEQINLIIETLNLQKQNAIRTKLNNNQEIINSKGDFNNLARKIISESIQGKSLRLHINKEENLVLQEKNFYHEFQNEKNWEIEDINFLKSLLTNLNSLIIKHGSKSNIKELIKKEENNLTLFDDRILNKFKSFIEDEQNLDIINTYLEKNPIKHFYKIIELQVNKYTDFINGAYTFYKELEKIKKFIETNKIQVTNDSLNKNMRMQVVKTPGNDTLQLSFNDFNKTFVIFNNNSDKYNKHFMQTLKNNDYFIDFVKEQLSSANRINLDNPNFSSFVKKLINNKEEINLGSSTDVVNTLKREIVNGNTQWSFSLPFHNLGEIPNAVKYDRYIENLFYKNLITKNYDLNSINFNKLNFFEFLDIFGLSSNLFVDKFGDNVFSKDYIKKVKNRIDKEFELKYTQK